MRVGDWQYPGRILELSNPYGPVPSPYVHTNDADEVHGATADLPGYGREEGEGRCTRARASSTGRDGEAACRGYEERNPD